MTVASPSFVMKAQRCKAKRKSTVRSCFQAEAKLMLSEIMKGRIWRTSEQPMSLRRQAEIY
jgi:hypothetical protein